MATALLDWIVDLMRDGSAREAFNDSPQAAMATAGFTSICGSDVRSFSEPSVREVGGVDFPQIAGASNNPQEITYVTNNYTIEAPSSSVSPTQDGPEVNGDGNTVTEENNPVDSSTDNTDDNSTDSDSEADNIVTGDDAAGEDQIRDSQLTDIGQGITGDDNSSFITLVDVVDTGDVHVLSDLVNDTIDNSLNFTDSPVLQDVLNGSVNDSVDDLLHHLL